MFHYNFMDGIISWWFESMYLVVQRHISFFAEMDKNGLELNEEFYIPKDKFFKRWIGKYKDWCLWILVAIITYHLSASEYKALSRRGSSIAA